MKRLRDGLMAAVLFVGLMGFLGQNVLAPVNAGAEEKAAKKTVSPAKKAKKKSQPVVTVTQQIIEFTPRAVDIDIIGTGFEPGQELRILYTDAEGMQTDIGYALKPDVKANNTGAFFTTWKGDEFIKAKLIQPGAMTLTVTNNEFKALAETNIFFKEAPKAANSDKKEEKKEKKEGGEKKEKK